jgi:hypothetical protein
LYRYYLSAILLFEGMTIFGERKKTMFLTFRDRMTTVFIHLLMFVVNGTETLQKTATNRLILPQTMGLLLKLMAGAAPVATPAAGSSTTSTPDCTTFSGITSGIGNFVHVLMGLGVGIAVIGIIIGGLMRVTSFGNERRIAMSNTAITCAIVGLVIVLFGTAIGNAIPGWFNISATGCNVN